MKEEPNDELKGRICRHIAIVILAFVLPIALCVGFMVYVCLIPVTGLSTLSPLAVLVVGVALLFVLSSIVNTALGRIVVNENIPPPTMGDGKNDPLTPPGLFSCSNLKIPS